MTLTIPLEQSGPDPIPCGGCGQFRPLVTSSKWPVHFCMACYLEFRGETDKKIEGKDQLLRAK